LVLFFIFKHIKIQHQATHCRMTSLLRHYTSMKTSVDSHVSHAATSESITEI